jgi:ionotropic glutamate receptor
MATTMTHLKLLLQAFKKNSSLTKPVSLSILSLAQAGDLQRLKDKWLGSDQCTTTDVPNIGLSLDNLCGLFITSGASTCSLWLIYGLYVYIKKKIDNHRNFLTSQQT